MNAQSQNREEIPECGALGASLWRLRAGPGMPADVVVAVVVGERAVASVVVAGVEDGL